LRAATPRSNKSRARAWAAFAFTIRASARPTSARCFAASASQRRDLEADEHVAAADAIALGLRHLGDSRGLWRHDQEIGGRRRRHDAGGMDDRANRPELRRLGLHRDDGFTLDVLGSRAAARSDDACQDEGRDRSSNASVSASWQRRAYRAFEVRECGVKA
jgi:hypothetical protein